MWHGGETELEISIYCFLTASEKYKEEHRASLLSSGSTDCFLIKPITIDDLVNKVNEMIKQK